MATNLTHAQRVTRLYRRSLKHLLSWCVDRGYWRQEALQLRDRFDANKDVTLKLGTLLLEEGEREFEKKKHPNPYILPTAPGGCMWERYNPPPSHVLQMTSEEEEWLKELNIKS